MITGGLSLLGAVEALVVGVVAAVVVREVAGPTKVTVVGQDGKPQALPGAADAKALPQGAPPAKVSGVEGGDVEGCAGCSGVDGCGCAACVGVVAPDEVGGVWADPSTADAARDGVVPRYKALLSKSVGFEVTEEHKGNLWRLRVVSKATDPQFTTREKDVRGWVWKCDHAGAAEVPSGISVGDHVEAKYGRDGQWYGATLQKLDLADPDAVKWDAGTPPAEANPRTGSSPALAVRDPDTAGGVDDVGAVLADEDDGVGFIAPHRQAHPNRRTVEGHLYGPRDWYGVEGAELEAHVAGFSIPFRLSASALALPVRVGDKGLPGSFGFTKWSVPARVTSSKWAIPVRDASGAAAPSQAAPQASAPPAPSSAPGAPAKPAAAPPAKVSGWYGSPAVVSGIGDQIFEGLRAAGQGAASVFLGPAAGKTIGDLAEGAKTEIDKQTGHDAHAGPFPVDALHIPGAAPPPGATAAPPAAPPAGGDKPPQAPASSPAVPVGATRGVLRAVPGATVFCGGDLKWVPIRQRPDKPAASATPATA
jgi:hypothetical protein